MKIKTIHKDGILFEDGSQLLSEYDELDRAAGFDRYVWFDWIALEDEQDIYNAEFGDSLEELIARTDGADLALVDKSGKWYVVPYYVFYAGPNGHLHGGDCTISLSYRGEKRTLDKLLQRSLVPVYREDCVSYPIRIAELYENGIRFSDGTCLQTCHESDCCEWHWADWSVLENYNINPKTGKEINLFELEFSLDLDQMIEPVADAGFHLVAIDGSKYFIPCYGDNNGYYTADITLVCGREGYPCEYVDLTKSQKIYLYGEIVSYREMRWKDKNRFLQEHIAEIATGQWQFELENTNDTK